MRSIKDSIDYVERLICGVRKQIEIEHIEIMEEAGLDDCIIGTWLDATILCDVVETEILPKLKDKLLLLDSE